MAQNKKKDVILSVVFSVVLLVAFLAFLNKDQIIKRFSSSEVSVEELRENPNQFPLSENGIGAHSFSCTVVDVLYSQYKTQKNYNIEVGVTCSYKDVDGNIQEINVPLVIENEAGYSVTQGYYQDYELPLYKPSDHMVNVEKYFYIENSNSVGDIYDDPRDKNYWDSDAVKPILGPGDEVVVTFVMNDSKLMTGEIPSEEWIGRIAFAKDYHENVYSYDNIAKFLETGNPKELDTEANNWIIPSWVKFIKDNNLPE